MSLRARKADRSGRFAGYRVDRAIIDIGSNTVRMVLYGGAPRAPITLFNEKVTARLGRDLAGNGSIPEEAMELALGGLARFALLLRELEVERIDVVATAAARDARNGRDFLDRVQALGLAVRLLPGEEEARLGALGVIAAFPQARGLVADLGGGSLELVQVADRDCAPGRSLPLGTLRLPAIAAGRSQAKMVGRLVELLGADGGIGPVDGSLYLVGGTWRAMAVHAIAQGDVPVSDPHAFSMDAGEGRALAKRLARTDPSALKANPRISGMRAEGIPAAANLLAALLEAGQPERLVFSSWGLREGVLYDGLTPAQRGQDPLLAGVSEFAAMRGCPPLLGTRIAAWTVDAIPQQSPGNERIRLAATMLGLASMQIEPNLRANSAMDWALHKRWIAITPPERALLAIAVAANTNQVDLPARITGLAPPDQIDAATCWGLAVRLCRRLGARSPRLFEVARIAREGGDLVLSIEASHAPLFGIPNDKDLAALAARMGLKPRFEVV